MIICSAITVVSSPDDPDKFSVTYKTLKWDKNTQTQLLIDSYSEPMNESDAHTLAKHMNNDREHTHTVEKFTEGGISEYPDWELHFDTIVGPSMYSHFCPHTYLRTKFSNGDSIGITPRVVVASNEGGHNVTAVCADCILEKIKDVDKGRK